MNVNGKHYRTVWVKKGHDSVIQIIDQRNLPHEFIIEDLTSVDAVARAIKEMHVRGAGLIGAIAGYGMYIATLEAPSNGSFDRFLNESGEKLKATRPTAVNLEWAVKRQLSAINSGNSIKDKISIALTTADNIADEVLNQLPEYPAATVVPEYTTIDLVIILAVVVVAVLVVYNTYTGRKRK